MRSRLACAVAVLLVAAAIASANATPTSGADVPLPVPRPHALDGKPAQAPPPGEVTRATVPAASREVQGPPLPPKTERPALVPPAGAPVQAEAAASCADALRAVGMVFEPTVIGPQPEPACVIAEPVKLSGIDPPSGLPIDFPDKPTIACATALVFADYLRDLLVPLARGQFGSAVAAVGTGPGFECRTRDHIPGAKLSAHALGLAIDIAELKLANGRRLDIGHPQDDGERAFDKGARAGACGFFHTALGPGADSFHENHWHFDLIPRGSKGDSRVCQ